MAGDKKTEDVAQESNVTVEPEQPTVPDEPKEIEEVSEEVKEPKQPKGPNKFKKIWTWSLAHKKKSIPLGTVLLLLLSFAIPQTRYLLLGTFIKKDVSLYIVDSETKGSLYNAVSAVTIDGKLASNAKDFPITYPAVFKGLPVGKHKVRLELGFYATKEVEVTVGLGKAKNKNIELGLQPTGRRVLMRVTNKINNKPAAGIRIKTGEIETITNDYGDASIVVDASLKDVEVELSGEGFKTLKTTAQLDRTGYDSNYIELTPTGTIYFLSKLSGKIDVVKTDLDGGNRKTVLAGTGKEEEGNTILLASRDWKYLALQSRREGTKPRLYLIDTATDKLTEIDSGDATFTLAGWADHNFLYTVQRNNIKSWQPKQYALKTFNAESGQLLTIDESNAEGTGDNDYAGESFSTVYVIDGRAIYAKNWFAAYYSVYRLAGKRMSIVSVKANGLEKQTLKDFDSGNNNYISSVLSEPNELYLRAYVNNAPIFYEYENGKLTDDKETNDESFYKPYPTFLQSPNGQSTFWSESRDGKNVLFTGNKNGDNEAQIASLSEFTPYGWYTDDYLLVSKGSSELYILPKEGDKDPMKVTDYHKPNVSYIGYGGGYGGL